MSETIRQTRAIVWLLTRFWLRGAVAYRSGLRRTQRSSGLLLRLLMFAFFAGMGGFAGQSSAGLRGGQRAVAILFLAFGTIGVSFTSGVGASGPTMRGPVGILESPFLDPLPLREASRVLTVLAQSVHLHAMGIAGFACIALPGHALRGGLLGFALTTCGLLLGGTVTRAIRVAFSPLAASRLVTGIVFLQFLPVMLVFDAPAIAVSSHVDRYLGRGIGLLLRATDGSEIAFAFAVVVSWCVGACLAIFLLERVGYDRVHALPTTRVSSSTDAPLGIGPVARLLGAREPGGRARWFAILYALFLVSAFWKPHVAKTFAASGQNLVGLIGSMASFVAFAIGSAFSWRAAERDLAARPLLSSLPITPADLLRDKAREAQRLTMTIATPLLLLPFLPGAREVRFEALWRVATSLIGLWITAGSVSSVAFLVVGLGASRRAGAMSGPSLESTLLLLPLIGVTSAPYLPSALISLTATALLSIEARRAALARVQWLEDDDVDPETPVWRALLVFASFQAVQSLLTQLAKLVTSNEALGLAGCYVLSAIALVALTLYERRGSERIAVVPESPSSFAWGVLGGLFSGAFAILYRLVLSRVGVVVDPLPESRAYVWLVPAFVIAAPLAEELFFRGQLQRVLEHDRSRAVAMLLSAFAFAAVHPPLSFLPVLALGLVTGALFLRTRAIGPGIAAHALHNAVALGIISAPHFG